MPATDLTPFSPDTLSDPSSVRLSTLSIPSAIQTPVPVVTLAQTSLNDKRVRVSMLPNSPAIFYRDPNNSLLSPLVNTNGVLFPYQPAVSIGFSASYQDQKVTHSDFTYHSYENSELNPMDISCDFPVRTPFEGQYVFAALHFLRCLTMMFTGNDTNGGGINLAGSPPLVVNLSGMGFGGLDDIPVAVTKVTTAYPDNVDYVSVAIPGLGGEIAKIPVLMNISISVLPMFSRAFASSFSVLRFASGARRLLGPYSPAPAIAPPNGGGVTNTVQVTSGPLTTIPTSTNTSLEGITKPNINTGALATLPLSGVPTGGS